jgi:hypothetical protein
LPSLAGCGVAPRATVRACERGADGAPANARSGRP